MRKINLIKKLINHLINIVILIRIKLIKDNEYYFDFEKMTIKSNNKKKNFKTIINVNQMEYLLILYAF